MSREQYFSMTLQHVQLQHSGTTLQLSGTVLYDTYATTAQRRQIRMSSDVQRAVLYQRRYSRQGFSTAAQHQNRRGAVLYQRHDIIQSGSKLVV
jgi:hypothetical protein